MIYNMYNMYNMYRKLKGAVKSMRFLSCIRCYLSYVRGIIRIRGNTMTEAQAIIESFVKKYLPDYSYVPDGDALKVTDTNGNSARFMVNMYGDIYDADTKDQVAISDLPHNWDDWKGCRWPNSWELTSGPTQRFTIMIRTK